MAGLSLIRMMGIAGLWGLGIVSVPAHAQSEHTVRPSVSSDIGPLSTPKSQPIQTPNKQAQDQSKQRSASTRVNLTVKDSTIKYIVYEIARQAKMRPVYDNSTPVLMKRTSVNLTNVDVMMAFAAVLKGTGLEARVASDGATVMIGATDTSPPRTQIDSAFGTTTGRVIDSADGEGLSGVAVAVRGTNLNVLTNSNGEFTLPQVPAGERNITFKLLGYGSATRTVRVEGGKRAVLNVSLKQTANMLSGVVTTVTGQQRKIEVGHSIVSLNVDSLQQVAPITSVTDLLESRVPGMTVQRTSGTPGDPARIRLRGSGSIYENNDPIIIVDGVRMYSQQSDDRNINQSGVPVGGTGSEARTYATPSPLDQIDPNMIETIDVLKGPSASAMYGSDAANGVIVITTKRGRPGPPRVNVNATVGTTAQPGSWPTSTYQFVTPLIGGPPVLCLGFCGEARVDSVVRFQALNHPYLTALGRGNTFNAATNVSGGTQTVMYSLSTNVARERGVLKLPKIEEDRYRKFHDEPAPGWMRRPDVLERRGMQGQLDVQFPSALRATATTLLTQSVQRRTSMSASGQSAVGELQRLWIDLSQLNEQPILGNPYERVTVENLTLQNSIRLNYRPASWIPAITGALGMNTVITSTEMQIARGMLAPPTITSPYATNESGGAYRAGNKTASTFTGNASTQVSPWQRWMTVSAGVNFDRGRTNDQSGALFGIPEGVPDPSIGEDTIRNEFRRSTSERVSFGWWVEPRLLPNTRLFVIPGFRLDNNGLSGKNAKFNGLPKMSFSWIVSDEAFFPWQSLMQMVRLRTSFGVSGVQPTPDELHRYYRRVTINPLNGQEPQYGDMMELATLGNTRLRPERVREVEGGIDLELWDSRIQLDVTHWRKERKDALVRNEIALSVNGGSTLKMNVGDLSNWGTEVSLMAQLVERRNLSINVGANFTRNESVVRRLNNPQSTGGAQGVRYVEGYPLDGVWKWPVLGYSDLDGDGWIGRSELAFGPNRIYVGSTEPRYSMNLHPTVHVLGGMVSVYATVSYVSGQLQSVEPRLPTTGSVTGMDPYLSDLVMGLDGFDRQVALRGLLGVGGPGTATDIGYSQKVNVTRWQSVAVNVRVPSRVTRALKASSASLSLQGQNLGLWTNYIGVDPNVNSVLAGHGLRDRGQQPEPRIWQLRLQLGY